MLRVGEIVASFGPSPLPLGMVDIKKTRMHVEKRSELSFAKEGLSRFGLPGWALFVVIVALAMGMPTLRGSFVGNDDRHLVLNNVLVNRPSLPHALEILRISHRDLYQPVPLLSFSLEFVIVRAFGLFDRGVEGGAWLFHLTNILLHAANSLLVFLLLRRLHRCICPTEGDASPDVVAAISAVLFAVHPLQVETVAWTNGRMFLLSTLFALSSVLASLRWREKGRIRDASWILVFALLCMASKVRVGLPVLLAIAAICAAAKSAGAARNSGRPWSIVRRLLGEPRFVVPWLLVTALTGLFVVINVGVTARNTELFELAAEHLKGSRGVRVVLALAWYIQHFVWPSGLASWYPAPLDTTWKDPGTIRALVVLAAATAALILLRRRRPTSVLGTVWFLGTIVDTLPIVPARNLLAADRYMYLSIIGLCWISADVLVAAYRRLIPVASHAFVRIATVGAGAAILATLLATSWYLQPFYETSIGKTSRIASLFPERPHVWARLAWAHHNAGLAVLNNGEPARAAEHFHLALGFAERELELSDHGGWSEAYQVLGATYLKLGHVDAGLTALRKALEIEPEGGEPGYRLACALDDLGKAQEALPLYETSHAIAPRHNPTILRLAKLYRRLGRPGDARRLYENALVNNDFEVSAILGLAELEIEAGDSGSLANAELRLQNLLKWMPDNAAALVALGVVYHKTGRTTDSIRAYNRALSLEPCNVSALLNLASIHRVLGQESDAAQLFDRADKCGPETLSQAVVISDYWLETRRASRSVDLWERFLSLHPDEEKARWYAAWALAITGKLAEAEVLLATPDPTENREPTALAMNVVAGLTSGNAAVSVEAVEALCAAPDEASEWRRRLLQWLEWFDADHSDDPWTLCLAAALLSAEGRADASRQFWELCDQKCTLMACRAFKNRVENLAP